MLVRFNASIQSAIYSYIITTSNALKIPIHLFSPWESFILHKTKIRLNHSHKHPVFTVRDKTENKEYLDILHSICNCTSRQGIE